MLQVYIFETVKWKFLLIGRKKSNAHLEQLSSYFQCQNSNTNAQLKVISTAENEMTLVVTGV
jgi:hypothetical protein